MNPYLILGVPMTASQDDIKNAYRRLAKLSHPDINKNAGAAEKFIEIKKAYEMLSGKEPRVQQQPAPQYHEHIVVVRYTYGGGFRSWNSSGTAAGSGWF